MTPLDDCRRIALACSANRSRIVFQKYGLSGYPSEMIEEMALAMAKQLDRASLLNVAELLMRQWEDAQMLTPEAAEQSRLFDLAMMGEDAGVIP